MESTSAYEPVKPLREFTTKEKIYYVTNDSVPREYVFEPIVSTDHVKSETKITIILISNIQLISRLIVWFYARL